MKFSIASLFSGVFLVVAPLLSYAYQLHVFKSMLVSVLAANGRLDFPELPVLWYLVSSSVGLVLIILGYQLERQSMRLAGRLSAPALAA